MCYAPHFFCLSENTYILCLTPTLTLNSEISIITRSIDRSYANFFLVTMLLDVKAVMLYSLRAVWIKSGLDGRWGTIVVMMLDDSSMISVWYSFNRTLNLAFWDEWMHGDWDVGRVRFMYLRGSWNDNDHDMEAHAIYSIWIDFDGIEVTFCMPSIPAVL